jgi:predicted nucleotidyltransferase
MEEGDILKKLIVQKLIRANVWGGKHTPLDFVIKGIPEHYRNTPQGKKIVEKTLKELKNEEWIIILAKRTGKGTGEHVSLNQRKVSEIKQFLMSNE